MLYFDNAATTPIREEAFQAMLPFLRGRYGNPSAVYSLAREARKAIEEARKNVARAIGADANEIVFTSGGTEANNWVLTALKNFEKKPHIITSSIEHHAVLHVCQGLEKDGLADITYLPVDKNGFVSPKDLSAAIRADTRLISIMWANNEIGTIQPISELAKIAKDNGILFHSDAVQAVGHIPVDMTAIPADFLTISAHKFGGPKAVGTLYIRKGNKLSPFIRGGAQERNRRAGTENVAGIVGMGAAIKSAQIGLAQENQRLSGLRDTLIDLIEENIPKSKLNGPRGNDRLPGNVNFTFDYIEGESMLLLLDMNGCAASSGSACSSASLEPSHVLMALGVTHEHAHGSIRFSLGKINKEEDLDALMTFLPKIVTQLRAMSPLAE
ncbi:MAG: cysteine desulfurase NifS [Turicibacter sp.]|nr:cysteine desulfurase NifS [Turicibacter sp.]